MSSENRKSSPARKASQAPRCPHCGDPRGDPMERTQRSRKMKFLLLGSRKYACNRCGRVYVQFLGRLFRRW